MGQPEILSFEDWRTGHAGERRRVTLADVPALYGLGGEPGSATFTWNDGGDPVLIVGVGPDWSTASLMINQYWYSYVMDDADGYVPIEVAGQKPDLPRSELLPRDAALPVLMMVPDLDGIRRCFRWLSQWRHFADDDAPDISLD
jgi:hypothetical protein